MSNSDMRDDALQRLDGRVAVVTGAGGGLGTAIVERLAALGASIVLLDLKEALVLPLAVRLEAAGTPCLAVACDIADDASVGAAAARVDERFGRCDILINNAGILPPPSSLLSMSLEVWDRTLAIDLRGVLLGTRH
ncbi:MAG: SDR family NAD(P)-dependent oxidoreductase, partial [Janthinobacterium lividum]